MSAPFRDSRLPGAFCVALPAPDDFEFWRERARALVQAEVLPEQLAWVEPGGAGDLFAIEEENLPQPEPGVPPVRASKAFVELARNAVCHSDPGRFALLYRLLWRLQANPRIMEDRADPDVRRLDELAGRHPRPLAHSGPAGPRSRSR